MSTWSPRRCHCCDGRGVVDPVPWPVSHRDRSDAATFLAIEASSLVSLAAMNVEGEIAEAIGAGDAVRLLAIAATYAAKVGEFDDDRDCDDEYMVDVYAEAASMIETGWPATREQLARALAESFEHGEIVIVGGRAKPAR